MTFSEIRLALYAGALAVICGVLLYGRIEHDRLVAVLQKDKAAADAQHARDVATNQGIVDENSNLRKQLASSAVAATPAPHLRLCSPPRYVSAGPGAGAVEPGSAPAGVGDRGVPGGAEGTTALDFGPVVQDLALAGVLRATNGDLLYEWGVRQAQSGRGALDAAR